MALPGTATPIQACPGLPSRSPGRAGMDRNSSACETNQRRRRHHEDRINEGGSLRDLYPRLDRPRTRTRLQLAKAGLGILFVAIGALVLTGFDKSIETVLVAASPSWLTDVTTRF